MKVSMPQPLKSIVVAYDGFEQQEQLPAIAETLAQSHGATVYVVHVAPELEADWWVDVQKVHNLLEALQKNELAARQAKLEALAAPLRNKGIQTEVIIRTGLPHVELIHEVNRINADLLIAYNSAQHQKTVGRSFGSVTHKLFRSCPCPVLACRDLVERGYRSVVAPVDLEDIQDELELNESILGHAADLAKIDQGKVTLFHAWNLWGEHLVRSRVSVEFDEVLPAIDDIKEARENHAQNLVSEFSRQCNGVKFGVSIEKGEVRSILPKVVSETGYDLVVLGSHVRTGITGFFIGNTAEKTLEELYCSVLVVKSKDFKTDIV